MSDKPHRHVAQQQLISDHAPQLHVEVAPDLMYIGHFAATITDDNQIENYFFVDKNTHHIDRLLYFQFEATAPKHPTMKTLPIAQHTFRYDGGVRKYRQARIDDQPDTSDVHKTVTFLNSQEMYFSEGDYYAVLRFVLPPVDGNQATLSIIYLERLQEAEIPPEIIAKSRHAEHWDRYCEQLLARAIRTFSICED